MFALANNSTVARSASLQQRCELRFDCNPPPVYLLSRMSMSLSGQTPLGLRLPSMAEFYLGSHAFGPGTLRTSEITAPEATPKKTAIE